MPKTKGRKPHGRKLPTLGATLAMGGRRMYAAEFVEVVTIHALKHGVAEASDYYELPPATIGKWVERAKEINAQAEASVIGRYLNPYRGTAYTIERRVQLSDKLFSELELTLEAERVKNDGHLPAHILAKLVTAYTMLVDKRRLEEGAHTAFVQEAKEPEDIVAEGAARVLEFRKRFALPEGNPAAALPEREPSSSRSRN